MIIKVSYWYYCTLMIEASVYNRTEISLDVLGSTLATSNTNNNYNNFLTIIIEIRILEIIIE